MVHSRFNGESNEAGVSNTNPDPLPNECPDDTEIIGFQLTGTTFTSIQIISHPFDKLDYPGNALIVTRLPSDSSNDASTELIIHASLKRKILRTPGFPKPLPTPTKSAPYVIQVAHDEMGVPMGLGMYATRDLNVGDLILAERPLIVFPETINLRALPGFHAGMDSCSADSMFEQLFRLAFARMDKGTKDAYMNLANCHNGGDTLVGIRNTNSYSISEFEIDIGENSGRYSCVMDKMSRFNHSCAPNAFRSFQTSSLSYNVYATRFIQEGEQVYLSYFASDDSSFDDRKSILRHFNIDCRCPICSLSPTELAVYEAFRTSLPARINDLNERTITVTYTMSLEDASASLPLLIHETSVLISDIEEYGMESSAHYLDALLCLYCLVTHYSEIVQDFDASAFESSIEKYAILSQVHPLS